MRIAIDVSSIIYGTGVSTYTKNLVQNLLKIDKKNEYVLFGGSLRRKDELVKFFSNLKGSFESKILTFPPTLADFAWNLTGKPKIERFIGKVDVFHSSDWAQPDSDAYNVTTVHDLVPLKFPRLSNPKIVATHTRRLKRVKRLVNKIIIPSKTTQKDLVSLGFDNTRTVIIPEAPDPIYKPASVEEIEKIKRSYRISGKYLLAVGITPRKNIERIVSAYEKIRTNDLKLVVIGHPHINIKPIRGLIMPGFVSENDLPAFYSGAEALVYPSLYEGFGLPILESFACKTPVVTSNVGTMKEIGEGSAVLVDPYDTTSIAEGIEMAVKNKKDIIKRGTNRVKEFSWENTAKMTLATYELTH